MHGLVPEQRFPAQLSFQYLIVVQFFHPAMANPIVLLIAVGQNVAALVSDYKDPIHLVMYPTSPADSCLQEVVGVGVEKWAMGAGEDGQPAAEEAEEEEKEEEVVVVEEE